MFELLPGQLGRIKYCTSYYDERSCFIVERNEIVLVIGRFKKKWLDMTCDYYVVFGHGIVGKVRGNALEPLYCSDVETSAGQK